MQTAHSRWRLGDRAERRYQAPQIWASAFDGPASTHWFPHETQAPLVQTSPSAHSTPQAPQLSSSLLTSVQRQPQKVPPPSQWTAASIPATTLPSVPTTAASATATIPASLPAEHDAAAMVFEDIVTA